MSEFQSFGKIIILIGAILIGMGLVILLVGKIPGVGRLPGDILLKKGNLTFYFPLATCFIISIVLTVIINLFKR